MCGEEHFRQRGSECAGPGAGVCAPTRQSSSSVAELSVAEVWLWKSRAS